MDLKKRWKCDSQKYEVSHNPDNGPIFGGNSLSLREEPMNKKDGGKSFIGISEQAGYEIEDDGTGNSVLTGDGASSSDGIRRFTLEEMEVYHITF